MVTRPKSASCLDHVYSMHGHFLSGIIIWFVFVADIKRALIG